MVELDEKELDKVFPSLRQVKSGYIALFTTRLKILAIFFGITALGFFLFFYLPDTNTFFTILHWIGFVLLFFSVGPVFVFFLIQPIFRFILQLIIAFIGMIKLLLVIIQYAFYIVLEDTIIGEQLDK